MYPVIELTIGLLWVLSSILFSDLNQIISYGIISSFLIAIAIIDYNYLIIPMELSVFLFI